MILSIALLPLFHATPPRRELALARLFNTCLWIPIDHAQSLPRLFTRLH